MIIDLRYALPALINTFAQFGHQISKLPAVYQRDQIFYVNLYPNTGHLAVDIEGKRAYRVARIGDPEGKDSHCTPELLALILKHINDYLDQQ
jgi:hypothetical protein